MVRHTRESETKSNTSQCTVSFRKNILCMNSKHPITEFISVSSIRQHINYFYIWILPGPHEPAPDITFTRTMFSGVDTRLSENTQKVVGSTPAEFR